MTSTTAFRVFRHGRYVASCKYAEDAALLIGRCSKGVVRVNKQVVWHEGHEGQPAAFSSKHAAEVMQARLATPPQAAE